MTDEFHGDEIILISHKTSSFSLLATSAKLMIFNIMKLSMKLPLRLALAVRLVSNYPLTAGSYTSRCLRTSRGKNLERSIRQKEIRLDRR